MMGEQLGDMTVVKARKDHKCDWCAEIISVDERYYRWAWKDGGEIMTTKMHDECLQAFDGTGEYEFDLFSNYRGCDCSMNPIDNCEWCADRAKATP